MHDTKYEQVIKGLLLRIDAGEWQAGKQILSERKLTELFGVSRITVQRAVDELVQRGTLERIAGRKGTFVSALPTLSDRKESRLIGVAVDDVSDLFGARILRGIEDCLWGRKYHTILCNADRNFLKVQEYFRSLSEQNLDGVIFSPVIEEEGYVEKNTDIIEGLRASGRPLRPHRSYDTRATGEFRVDGPSRRLPPPRASISRIWRSKAHPFHGARLFEHRGARRRLLGCGPRSGPGFRRATHDTIERQSHSPRDVSR